MTTMAEYIERESAVAYFERSRQTMWHKDDVAATLSNRSIHAADVQAVRHGDWLVVTEYKTPLSHAYIRKEKRYVCPYCREAYRKHMNFCGNCGAKMDGKGDTNAVD